MKRSGAPLEIIEPQVTHPLEPLSEESGPYRLNVASLLVRHHGSRILLGERFDTPNCWQWPQGGLEQDELPEDGLRRELAEEIGIASFNILYRFPFKLRYRFPRSIAAKFQKVGQEQYYFIVETTDTPDLDRAVDREFRQLKWVPLEQVLDTAVWFKKEVYRHAIGHLEQIRPQLRFSP